MVEFVCDEKTLLPESGSLTCLKGVCLVELRRAGFGKFQFKVGEGEKVMTIILQMDNLHFCRLVLSSWREKLLI